LLKESSEIVAKSSEALGLYEEAYQYYVVFKTMNDSIFNESNLKKITGLEYQYKYEKEKQALKLEQQKKNAVMAEEVKRQKVVRNYLIIGFVLMALLVLMVLTLFFQKRKANLTLVSQQKQIEYANDELKQTIEELNQINEELNTSLYVIGEQKEEIEQKEHRLDTILQNMEDGFGITDFDENFTFSNTKACEIFNVVNGELIGKNLREFLDDKEWDRVRDESEKRKLNLHSSYDINIKTKNQKEKTLIVSTAPDYNEKGKIIGTIATFVDITERIKEKEQLETLNTQLNKYFSVIEQSPVVIVFADIAGNIEYVNPQFTKKTGYTSNEVVGNSISLLKSGLTPVKTYTQMWKTILSGNIWKGEFINKSKNGDIFVEKTIISPIKDDAGKIINYTALKEDVTELKKAEQALKNSQEKYKAILTNMDDVFYQTDINQNLVLISPSALKYTNFKSVSEMIGKNVPQIFYYKPNDRVKLIKALQENKGSVTNYEVILKNKDNTAIPFETNSHFVYDNEGNPVGVEGILRNITEQKEAEKKLELQKEQIEAAHKDITDSIIYAKTIQDALFTSKELIDLYLDNYFILHKPKEQVGGDFYYLNKIGKRIIIAIADCTGHGVPGAFITMLGITYLHEISKLKKINNPGEALNFLRERFKRTFGEFGSENNNGLDIALCSINTETNILQYAGAYNPLIIIRNNELIEYKATRNPVGFYLKEVDFKNHKIQLYDNDIIYLYSDGYQDQVGGRNNKKFLSKKYKKMLFDIHKHSMKEQKKILLNTHEEWKGKNEQTDDILIFGMKFNE
jgi:PAS domain S-box-containing protein